MSELHGKIDTDLKEFHKRKSLDPLRSAVALAQGIQPRPGASVAERRKLRDSRLVEMLTILDAIDVELDRTFDPSDTPSSSVTPPVVNGVVLDSGIDPKHVKDPQVRAAYEQAIAKNNEKARKYAFQKGLQQIDNDVTREVHRMLSDPYNAPEQTRHTTRETISRLIKDPQRRAGLLQILEQNR